MTIEQIKEAGMETYFVDHTAGIYPQAAAGFPFDAKVFASKGDASSLPGCPIAQSIEVRFPIGRYCCCRFHFHYRYRYRYRRLYRRISNRYHMRWSS